MDGPPRSSMSKPRFEAWWLAIRPKTLSAVIAPVAVGSALAYQAGVFRPLPALAALLGGLLIQIGTNLSNDLLDYRRGADTAERLGPTRVVQAGLIAPRRVAWAAALAFGLAALVGLYLVAQGGLPILLLGLASIAAGILYTAGPYPLAYLGLGDLFVLLFFGLAALGGTYYVQAGAAHPAALPLGAAVGAFSVAILNVNNLRDIETDRAARKHTLALRLGEAWTRSYFAALVAAAFAIPLFLVLAAISGRSLAAIADRGLGVISERGLGAGVVLVLLALPLALRPVRLVRAGARGAALNPVLGMTARAQMGHALCLSGGLILERLLRQGLGIG